MFKVLIFCPATILLPEMINSKKVNRSMQFDFRSETVTGIKGHLVGQAPQLAQGSARCRVVGKAVPGRER